jgi:hypothetical protein
VTFRVLATQKPPTAQVKLQFKLQFKPIKVSLQQHSRSSPPDDHPDMKQPRCIPDCGKKQDRGARERAAAPRCNSATACTCSTRCFMIRITCMRSMLERPLWKMFRRYFIQRVGKALTSSKSTAVTQSPLHKQTVRVT